MSAILASLRSPEANWLPATAGAAPSDQQVKNHLIGEVAKSCFSELALSLAFTGVTTLFVTTSAGIASLIILTIAITTLNTAFKSVSAYLQYRCFQLQRDPRPEAAAYRQETQELANYFSLLAPFSFTALDTTTRNVLVHEGGHALAANLVYKGANPRIEVFPMEGGVTSYFPRLLSNFGKHLGWKNADLLVSAAGSGAAVLSAAGGLVLATHIRETHPQLHSYLVALSIASIVQHVLYALSALWAPSKSLGHDFVALWRHGIHPIVSAISLVALPAISVALFGKRVQQQQLQSSRI